MEHKIQLQNRSISYELQRKKVKNINLHVKADLQVVVSAHPKVPLQLIEDFLIRKSDWIEKTLEYYEERIRKEGTETGEWQVSLLDKKYPVRIIPASDNRVEWLEDTIIIFRTNLENREGSELILENWVSDYAVDYITKLVKKMYPLFASYGIPMPQVKFRSMKSRWGSCSPHLTSITLNIELIHVPKECIEYVIAHEFAHFIQPNHSRAFYAQLAEFIPDYQQRKQKLRVYRP